MYELAVDERLNHGMEVLAVGLVHLAGHDQLLTQSPGYLDGRDRAFFRGYAAEEEEVVLLVLIIRETGHVYGVVDHSHVVPVGAPVLGRATDSVVVPGIMVPYESHVRGNIAVKGAEHGRGYADAHGHG